MKQNYIIISSVVVKRGEVSEQVFTKHAVLVKQSASQSDAESAGLSRAALSEMTFTQKVKEFFTNPGKYLTLLAITRDLGHVPVTPIGVDVTIGAPEQKSTCECGDESCNRDI